MLQANSFIFDSYEYDRKLGKIFLRYSLDTGIEFEEVLTLPHSPEPLRQPSDAALFLLHLAGGASYYKTCVPQKIEVHSGTLSPDQARFWNTVYTKGLGEFFYQNKIDYHGLVQFPQVEKTVPTRGHSDEVYGPVHSLVPIGGGKDSLVTIENLKKECKSITLFRLGAHPLIDAVVKQTGLPCLTVERTLSPKLFELNEQGALNGHVPISAYISALCIVLADMYDFDEVVMSNEQSANYGNTEYLGEEINHQWSKSEEFETLFQDYIHQNVSADITYYSALRSMNELQIAKELSNYPQYFELFTSCNKNWKVVGETQKHRWCNACPKCAFSFCLMSAYLSTEELLRIFGENLYEDESLIPLYKELAGLEGIKPFECVGTPEETKEALRLAYERGELSDTPIMQLYRELTS